jgi:AcrR family transcriptional regulator
VAELTPARIARAALEVADEHGAGGFSMRLVAERLGVTPMALYHHVDDKAALVALLVDEVIAETPLPSTTGRWRDDLCALALWMRQSALAHPAVGRLRNDYQVWTPSIFPMTERWLSVWQQSGLNLDAAMSASSASATAIIGFVEQEMIQGQTEPPDASMLASFPNARLSFALEVERDGSKEFELVLGVLIDGLHAALLEGPGPSTPTTREGRPSSGRSTTTSRSKPRSRRA